MWSLDSLEGLLPGSLAVEIATRKYEVHRLVAHAYYVAHRHDKQCDEDRYGEYGCSSICCCEYERLLRRFHDEQRF